MRMRLRDDTCDITVDGWCAVHSDGDGPMFCLEQTQIDVDMRELIRWRKVVEQYACPVCIAGPREQCVTNHGKRKNEPHADRARLAAYRGWTIEM